MNRIPAKSPPLSPTACPEPEPVLYPHQSQRHGARARDQARTGTVVIFPIFLHHYICVSTANLFGDFRSPSFSLFM